MYVTEDITKLIKKSITEVVGNGFSITLMENPREFTPARKFMIGLDFIKEMDYTTDNDLPQFFHKIINEIRNSVLESDLVQNVIETHNNELRAKDEDIARLEAEIRELKVFEAHFNIQMKLNHGSND